jgi:plastocyanin
MPWNRGLPLALLLALVCPSAVGAETPPSSERIEIVLSNFAFTPSSIHLRQGRPYQLHFVNQGSGGHNFAAKSFFASARISGEAPPGGVVELRKGESRDVSLVPAAGRYKLKCTHFLHSGFGMKGEIIVD